MTQNLSVSEQVRYSRHLMLPEIGMAGQLRLKESAVLLIGLGGLGSPLAMYLAAAGIGRLGLVDPDRVDLSNLQRQIIHSTTNAEQLKVDSAAATIRDLNPHIKVECYPVRFDISNAESLAAPYDVIIDGTDNFATRYLVNDIAVMQQKPNIYGSILRFEGQATVLNYKGGPCYRCIFPTPPPSGLIPSCGEAGVIGVLPGLIGMIQATEAIKVLLSANDTLQGRLLCVDAWKMKFRELKIRRNPQCSVCGDQPSITTLRDENYVNTCENPAPVTISMPRKLSIHEYRELRENQTPHILIDVREEFEFLTCNLGGKLIPLSKLKEHLVQLPKTAMIIVHCKSGGRSATAAKLLCDHGFEQVYNLEGGILAWIDQIDPSLPKY